MATFRRRRVLGLLAAPLAVALPAGAFEGPIIRWRGTVLGAEASLTIHGLDAARATRLIERALGEIDRLDAIFSLHRRDSALQVLNRTGRLQAPPLDLVDVLAEARRAHELSSGAFDVTIQPLWRLHAEHFARPRADAAGPRRSAIEEAMQRIGFADVEVAPKEIRFLRRGMAVTLNGIAQGTITDRVADLLRDEGLQHVLVELGEIAAIGPNGSGFPWTIAVGREGASERIKLENAAAATSSPSGSTFDTTGRHHHLLDPRTGRSSRHGRPVTVVAARASRADALSTALAVMPPAEAHDLAMRLGPEVQVIDAASSAGPTRRAAGEAGHPWS